VSPTLLEHTLTHCVNSRRIAEVFPGQDIMFIKSDLQASLRREWLLHGHKRFVDRQIKKDVSRLCHYEAIKDRILKVMLYNMRGALLKTQWING
jgi:hypothetical protein